MLRSEVGKTPSQVAGWKSASANGEQHFTREHETIEWILDHAAL